MENYKKIIGKNIYKLRKQKKYPVQHMTDRLNIARSTYNGYEAGSRAPNAKKLAQIAIILDTTIDYLIGKTDNPHKPTEISPLNTEDIKLIQKLKEYPDFYTKIINQPSMLQELYHVWLAGKDLKNLLNNTNF